jgi:hypothetical protein
VITDVSEEIHEESVVTNQSVDQQKLVERVSSVPALNSEGVGE